MPVVHSVGVSLPDLEVSNSRVKELVSKYSDNVWLGKRSELEWLIDEFFEKSGAKVRVWRGANSLPKTHIKEAVEKCFRAATEGAHDQISSIIFCGIDRGFVEPAHASVLAAQLGFDGIRAFDIADACMGWFTACQVATVFATQNKPLSLIISAEFPLDDPGLVLPGAFTLRNAQEFQWKAAALTLGEMATATLVDAHQGLMASTVRSENQHNQLCVVPIKKPHRFMDWDQPNDFLEFGCFIANGAKLAIAGYRPGLAVLKEQIGIQGKPDHLLPHAFSETVPNLVAAQLGVNDRLHNVFQRVGNISTSSIPFALWSLDRSVDISGKSLMGWVASAGMKHAAFEIKWQPSR